MKVGDRLARFFHKQSPPEWWAQCKAEAEGKFRAANLVDRQPAGHERIQAILWCRTITCPKCSLNIPLSTNFHIVTKKGKPEASVAAFPEVPLPGQGNDCKFRIVGVAEWKNCRWPRLGSDPWHPRDTPSYRDGHAICPRCGTVVDEADVKKAAQSKAGGLPCQMYAVCSKLPVKLSYRDGSTRVRQL